MIYSARCISMRGKTHILKEKKGQDSAGAFCNKEYAIIAVADGHGSAPHIRSDVGSRYAVKVALETMSQYLSIKNNRDNYYSKKKDMGETIIRRWRGDILNHYQTNPLSSSEKEEISGFIRDLGSEYHKLYGTTLIAVGMFDDCCIGIQIGDGGVAAIYSDFSIDYDCFNEDTGCLDNLTTSLSENRNTFRSFYMNKKRPIAFAAYTDGLDNSVDKVGLSNYLKGIIALSQDNGYWYNSVVPLVKRCSEHSMDDTSLSILLTNNFDLNQLYENAFSMSSPGLSFKRLSLPEKMITTDGCYEGTDYCEYIEWEYNDKPYSGYRNNGRITKVFDDSRIYEGSFDDYSISNPNVIVKSSNGILYEGGLLNGKYHGKGIEYNTQYRREGRFINGLLEGEGADYFRDTGYIHFKGIFCNGKYKQGNIFYNGSGEKVHYSGEYNENLKQPSGNKITIFSKSGKVQYVGEVYNGLRDGVGIDYTDDKPYKGSFKDGIKEIQSAPRKVSCQCNDFDSQSFYSWIVGRIETMTDEELFKPPTRFINEIKKTFNDNYSKCYIMVVDGYTPKIMKTRRRELLKAHINSKAEVIQKELNINNDEAWKITSRLLNLYYIRINKPYEYHQMIQETVIDYDV